MKSDDAVMQCGDCGAWVKGRFGEFVPSGNRHPRTGETPHDNFVCRHCYREARQHRLVHAALDRHNTQAAA